MNLITIDEIKIAKNFTRKNLGEVRAGCESVILTYHTCTATIMPRGKTNTPSPDFLLRIESKHDRNILM